jgi:Putative Actinobacterial Holin-X, holin superfamily III
MSAPGVEKVAGQSFGDVAQTVSEQAVVLLRQEAARARRELTAKAGEASAGAAMVGGAVVLGSLATGTGTAALVLFLSRRTEASAAALGVTGLYAGGAALLAREGITRLRTPAPPVPEKTVERAKKAPSKPRKKPARPAQERARSTANRTRKAASAARPKKP